ncbi:hypothetical protein AB9T88_18360, partial [Flavobacterium sp. LBUM151]
LVGKYYVEFEKAFQNEYSNWQKTIEYSKEFLKDKNTSLVEKLMSEDGEMPVFFNDGGIIDEDLFTEEGDHKMFRSNFKDKYFNTYSALGKEVKEMLQKWEAGDDHVVTLWKMMNQWVYDGFATTYSNLGVNFDKYYYESNTYLLGKDVVQVGLDKGVFEKDPDGSVWIDLTDEGLDRKIVLRSDGTA